MTLSRRAMVAGLGALAAPFVPPSPAPRPVAPGPPAVPVGRTPDQLARDEGFWSVVARQYRVSPDFVNLENGYYGIMPEPVRRAYHRNVDQLNEVNSRLLRTTYKEQADQVGAYRDPPRRLHGGDRPHPRRHRGPAEPDRRLSAAAPGRRGDVHRPRLSQRAVRHELAARPAGRAGRADGRPRTGDPPGRAGRLRRGAA